MSNYTNCNVIHCKGKTANNKPCNNPIGIKNGNKLTIKRHNREIHITLTKNQTVEIICEKCGKKTIITEN